MDETLPIPELGDAEYCAEVLELPVEESETNLDQELVAKANALGIKTTLPSICTYKRKMSTAVSEFSESTSQERTFSTSSDGTASTYLTPHSSIFGPPSPNPASLDAPAKSLSGVSFYPYEKYLAQDGPTLDPSRSHKLASAADNSPQSIFSLNTRKSFSSIRSRMKLRRKPSRSFTPASSCTNCRTDGSVSPPLQSLPCGHALCTECLRKLVDQAAKDETKMPPRCCTPVPASNIQAVLDTAAQETFLKAVVQFNTPWESRIFCSNASCGEFIPHPKQVDPNAPFTVACRKCHTRVCNICKGDAHPIGNDCPKDLEVETEPGTEPGQGTQLSRKRCYNCRGLVERRQGSTHLTCVCKAEFCSVCGGVWDTIVGCPNICSNEEESGKCQDSDETKAAQDTAPREDKEAAEKRSAEHPDIQVLQEEQNRAMQRFSEFMDKMKTSMEMRQWREKISLSEKEAKQVEELKDKHARETAQLEDNQITEEMELQSTLEQSERSINFRIKHMEAYCDGPGCNPSELEMPPRVVTEQNLRDLNHQYKLRDEMQRRHQSKINMIRERQSKSMEDLLDSQEVELEKLAEQQQSDRREVEGTFVREEEAVDTVFGARQSRLTARWNLAIQVLCKELESKDGLKYALVPAPSWPSASKTDAESTVTKEEGVSSDDEVSILPS